MNHYFVQIQLRDYNEKDEAELVTSMINAGFSRTIADKNGAVYMLPSADFHISSDSSFEEVYRQAGQAASGRPFSILMVQVAQIGFFGLQKAHS